jgi:ankyrin repeat protein
MSLLEVAVMGRHFPLINIFMQQNHISNFSNHRLTSILTHAVVTEDPDVVQLIISHMPALAPSICGRALTSACQRGCSDIVGMLLDACPDADTSNLMYITCLKGDTDTLKHLLRAGASLHKNPNNNFIPMLWSKAQSPGLLRVVVALLDDGGYLDRDSGSSLRGAATGGSLSLVKELLSRGTFNEDSVGRALVAAASGGSVEVVELLLSHATQLGARISCQQLFFEAVRCGHDAVASRLLSLYPDAARGREHHALHSAVSFSCGAVVAALLAGGAVDVTEHIGRHGRTILSMASDAAIARMLLDANAAVKPASNYSVLEKACEKLCPETVRVLLEAGADANGISGHGPILHCLVMTPCTDDQLAANIEILELLLDAGAALEPAEDSPWPSALHRCVMSVGCQGEAVARVLLGRCPSLVEARYGSGRTPLDVALGCNNVELVRLFVDERTSLPQQCRSVALLANVFSVEFISRNVALDSRIREVLRLVLGAGVDVMGVDKHGCTALMMAVDSEHTKFGDTAAKAYISDIIDHIRGVELI